MNQLNYKKIIASLIAAINFVSNVHIIPDQTFAGNEVLTEKQQLQVETLTKSVNEEHQTQSEVFIESEAVSEEQNTQPKTLIENEAVSVEQNENSQPEALVENETATNKQPVQPEALIENETATDEQSVQPEALVENEKANDEQPVQPEALADDENKEQISQPEVLVENKAASEEQSKDSQPETLAETEKATDEQPLQMETLTADENKEQISQPTDLAENKVASEEQSENSQPEALVESETETNGKQAQPEALIENETATDEQSVQPEALVENEKANDEKQAQSENLTADANKEQISQPTFFADNKVASEEQSENSQPKTLVESEKVTNEKQAQPEALADDENKEQISQPTVLVENKVASKEQSENSQPEALVESETETNGKQASQESYCVVEIFFNDDVDEEQQAYPTVLYIIETSLNDEAESEQQLSQVVTLSKNANKEQYVKVKPFAENVTEKQNFQTKTFCIEKHMYDSELNTRFPFFLLISRMQGINRWHILNNMKYENLEDHSFETAVIAHILANIKNEYFGGQVNPEHLVMLALFHDTTEIFTGDIPSPVHYNNCVKDGFELIEKDVAAEILKTLPEKLRRNYLPIIMQNNLTKEDLKLLKAADKISALMKCIRELQLGNKAFLTAAKSIYKSLQMIDLAEVNFFMENFLAQEFLEAL